MFKGLNTAERFAWNLIQSLWVGGIWLTMLIIFPSLDKTLVAPILIFDIISSLAPRVIIAAVSCIIIQLIIYVKAISPRLSLLSMVPLCLLIALLACIVFLGAFHLQLASARLLSYCYFFIGVCGVVMMFNSPRWAQ